MADMKPQIFSIFLTVPEFLLKIHQKNFIRSDQSREMESISRGPTYVDFCHHPHQRSRCRTSRLQDCKVQEYVPYRLHSPPLLNVMYEYFARVFLKTVKISLRYTKEKGAVGNLYISLNLSKTMLIRYPALYRCTTAREPSPVHTAPSWPPPRGGLRNTCEPRTRARSTSTATSAML